MHYYFSDDKVSAFYLMYKLAISIYFVIGYSLNAKSYISNGTWAYAWIYLTHWSFILMIVSFLYNTLLVCVRFWRQNAGKRYGGEHFFEKDHPSTMISWALSGTANTVAVSVTVAYWTALYPGSTPPSTAMSKFNNFDVHLIQVIH